MRISENNLEASLNKELASIYVLMSNEVVLIEENLEKIYLKSNTQDFKEKQTHLIDNQTQWDFLTSKSDNLDLFGSKKIIEIKLLSKGPGTKGAKVLKEYASQPDPNVLLIISGVGLEKKTYTSSWVKSLEQAGVFILIESFSEKKLLEWISKKGTESGVNISTEAGEILAEKTEGNLLATLQEINKLALIYPSEDIDLKKMTTSITNSSKYSVFDFSNAFISGNSKKTLSILEFLKAEGTPESLVIWSLSRELNNLFKVIQNDSVKGIWGPNTYLDILLKSSKRIEKTKVIKAFTQIALIDSSIKGFTKDNPWILIRELTLNFKY